MPVPAAVLELVRSAITLPTAPVLYTGWYGIMQHLVDTDDPNLIARAFTSSHAYIWFLTPFGAYGCTNTCFRGTISSLSGVRPLYSETDAAGVHSMYHDPYRLAPADQLRGRRRRRIWNTQGLQLIALNSPMAPSFRAVGISLEPYPAGTVPQM